MSAIELMAPDLVRLAFVAGMVLSVVLYERSHLTTGSIVVPGFFGIHIFEPTVIVASVVNALFCYYLIHKLGPRLVFTSTKTKFHLLVLCSILLQIIWNGFACYQAPVAVAGNAFAGFGCVIPGLIAHDMARNGPARTVASTLLVSAVVGAGVFLLVFFLPSTAIAGRRVIAPVIDFDLLLVLSLSTLAAMLLKLTTPLRSGGYVTAAYFVFLGNSPETLVVVLVAAISTYCICCGLLIPRMIIFGRRKFALMLIIGALSTWSYILILGEAGLPMSFVNHPSYAGIMILLPGLIANDMQRSNFLRVASGLALTATATFIFASLYYEIRSFGRPGKVVYLTGLFALTVLPCFLSARLVRAIEIREIELRKQQGVTS